jgi:hypothetical protein
MKGSYYMSKLEKQNDNEFKDCYVKVTLDSNSSYEGRFIECTENGFVGIITESGYTNVLYTKKTSIMKYVYFPKENIRFFEIRKDC